MTDTQPHLFAASEIPSLPPKLPKIGPTRPSSHDPGIIALAAKEMAQQLCAPGAPLHAASPMSRSELIDVEVMLHHETKPDSDDEGAFKVSLDGDEKRAVWIPKSASQIQRKARGIAVLTLKEPLALAKGLI